MHAPPGSASSAHALPGPPCIRVHHPCLQIIIIKVVKVRLLLVLCAAAYACKPIARGACACHVAVPARLLHWQGAHSTTATVALLQCSTRCPSRRWHLPVMRLLPCTPGPLQHRQLWMWSALRHSLVNLVSGNAAVLHVNTADTNPGRCCSAGEAREGALRGELASLPEGAAPRCHVSMRMRTQFISGVPLLLPPRELGRCTPLLQSQVHPKFHEEKKFGEVHPGFDG